MGNSVNINLINHKVNIVDKKTNTLQSGPKASWCLEKFELLAGTAVLDRTGVKKAAEYTVCSMHL